eukprot:404895_1
MSCSIKGMKNVRVSAAVDVNNSIDDHHFINKHPLVQIAISQIANNNNIINVATDTFNATNYYATTEYNIFNNTNDCIIILNSEILIPFLEWERLLLRIPKLFNENKFISESENKSCLGA